MYLVKACIGALLFVGANSLPNPPSEIVQGISDDIVSSGLTRDGLSFNLTAGARKLSEATSMTPTSELQHVCEDPKADF